MRTSHAGLKKSALARDLPAVAAKFSSAICSPTLVAAAML